MKALRSILTWARKAVMDLLSWLNSVANIVFMYLSLNSQLPPQAETVIKQIPEPWQMIVRLALPVAWFSLIEFAKSKAIKRATENVAS